MHANFTFDIGDSCVDFFVALLTLVALYHINNNEAHVGRRSWLRRPSFHTRSSSNSGRAAGWHMDDEITKSADGTSMTDTVVKLSDN